MGWSIEDSNLTISLSIIPPLIIFLLFMVVKTIYPKFKNIPIVYSLVFCLSLVPICVMIIYIGRVSIFPLPEHVAEHPRGCCT